MKLRMSVLSASVVLLAACASSGATTGYVPQKTHPQTRLAQDEAYMAHVEALARRRGIDLTWVNPPQKIVASDE
jgi:hypothetical protein